MADETWTDRDGNLHYGKKIDLNAQKGKIENDGAKIKIKIDSTEEYNRIKEQNSDLKARLGIANQKILEHKAEKTLDEAEKLGIKTLTSIENPEQLDYVKRQIQNERHARGLGRDLPLSSQQLGNNNHSKSVMNQEFSTVSEMVTALAEANTPESKNAVANILKQTQRTGVSEFEFDGSFQKLKLDSNESKKFKKVR